jgi:flagellar hook-associated protein 1 FlgK
VTRIGGDISGAASQSQTQEQLLIAAQNLRDSFSGVDLNEEAVKLAEFEQAYQAILRVVQVLDGLSQEVLNLVS